MEQDSGNCSHFCDTNQGKAFQTTIVLHKGTLCGSTYSPLLMTNLRGVAQMCSFGPMQVIGFRLTCLDKEHALMFTCLPVCN